MSRLDREAIERKRRLQAETASAVAARGRAVRAFVTEKPEAVDAGTGDRLAERMEAAKAKVGA